MTPKDFDSSVGVIKATSAVLCSLLEKLIEHSKGTPLEGAADEIVSKLVEPISALHTETPKDSSCGHCTNCQSHDTKPLAENVTANSNVDHPKHYQGKHECIDVMRAMFGDEAVMAFCKCNSFKYRFRADAKNKDEDIAKAEWYEDYLMKMLKEQKKDWQQSERPEKSSD